MIISICSTYLCRKGCIDEDLCLVAFIFGIIEIFLELVFLALVLRIK